jgi:drug/metabolite transporter (DMT)-like permease
LILAAAVLWSLSGLFVKSLQMPPAAVAMYRTLSAGVVLLLAAALFRSRITWSPAMLWMLAAFTVMNYVFVASMTYTTSANAIFLQYTAPVWMTLGSVVLLGESSDRRQWTVLAGSLVGVGVIVVGNLGAGGDHLLGIALGLVSGFMYAGVALSLRFLRNHDPLWLAALNHASAGLVLLGVNASLAWAGAAPWSNFAFPDDPRQGALLLAFGVVQMGVPYILFGMGMQRVSPQEAGVLTLVEPVLNPIWTALGAREIPSVATMAGGAILVSMLALRYAPRARRE